MLSVEENLLAFMANVEIALSNPRICATSIRQAMRLNCVSDPTQERGAWRRFLAMITLMNLASERDEDQRKVVLE